MNPKFQIAHFITIALVCLVTIFIVRQIAPLKKLILGA